MKTRKIYMLESGTVDELVDGYMDSVKRYSVHLPKPQRDVTWVKLSVLLHCLVERAQRQKPNEMGQVWFPLNTALLEDMFGQSYKEMLLYLKERGIIERTTRPDFGYDVRICCLERFQTRQTSNVAIVKKLDRFRKLLEKRHKEKLKEAAHFVSCSLASTRGTKTFMQRYNQSLQFFHLVDKEKAKELMSREKPTVQPYFNYLLRSADQNARRTIFSADANGRVYHIATSMPHKMLKFTNIAYSMDAHNSHPLLFNHLIYLYYLPTVSVAIYLRLSNYLYGLSSFYLNIHYFTDNLCKSLEIKNIKSGVIAQIRKIPYDVWYYLFLTTHGALWDELAKKLNTDRSLVKKKMFADVFYSKSRIYRGNPEKASYRATFKKAFPTVWKIINHYKMEQHKSGSHLACLLMQEESRIFLPVLQTLYRKGVKAIGRHDEICILDSPEAIAPLELESLLVASYARFGLRPTLSLEKMAMSCKNDGEYLDSHTFSGKL